jgi:HAD superfamily hydrolase (TIGR01509 family)
MSDIQAVLFDQDGVIIDTERDGHRVAFNRTFKEFGFDVEWDVDTYHGLLQVGGGKERMRHYMDTVGFGKAIDDPDQLIKDMHKRKTDIFIELIESGQLPPRPGVRRLMHEIMDAGLTLAICTTSNERAANAVAGNVLSDVKFDFILAGDVVSRKKPDPEIYQMALARTGLSGSQAVVIEDSHNGLVAAKAAGCNCVVTTNGYTEQEDASMADVVVTCLGDPEGEKGTLTSGPEGLDFNGVLTVEDLKAVFADK